MSSFNKSFSTLFSGDCIGKEEHLRYLLCWYPWETDSYVLWIKDNDCKRTNKELIEKQQQLLLTHIKKVSRVDVADYDELDKEDIDIGVYDYVVIFSCFEEMVSKNLLVKLISRIKPDGKILINVENRIGIRYFCGERDTFAHEAYAGIQNYDYVNNAELSAMLFSKAEIERILQRSGLFNYRFYSCFPDALFAEQICLYDFWTDDLGMTYQSDRENNCFHSVSMNSVLPTLVENRLSHVLANDWLIECSKKGSIDTSMKYIKMELDRGPESIVTRIVEEDGMLSVIKNSKKFELLKELDVHTKELKKLGINVIEGELYEDEYRMPYVEKKERGLEYFERLYFTDKEKYKNKIDEFIKCLLSVSEKYEESGNTYMYKAYPEMIPTNCFVVDDDFLFFDQEEMEINVLVDSLVFRCLLWLANENTSPSLMELCNRYGIDPEKVVGKTGLSDAIMRHRKKLARIEQTDSWKSEKNNNV